MINQNLIVKNLLKLKNIAVVGIKNDPKKAVYFVSEYLIKNGKVFLYI